MEHGQNKLKYDQIELLCVWLSIAFFFFFRADIKILQHVSFMGGWIKGNLCVFVKSYAFIFWYFQKYFWFEKY